MGIPSVYLLIPPNKSSSFSLIPVSCPSANPVGSSFKINPESDFLVPPPSSSQAHQSSSPVSNLVPLLPSLFPIVYSPHIHQRDFAQSKVTSCSSCLMNTPVAAHLTRAWALCDVADHSHRASLLFLEHTGHMPAAGPLHLLFPCPETISPRYLPRPLFISLKSEFVIFSVRLFLPTFIKL